VLPDPEPLKASYDLDLTRLSDEPLVTLFKECGYGPARTELLRRHQGPSHLFIRRLSAHSGLQEADRQDLGQEAVLWIVEAIRRYRTDEGARSGGCQFHSFLHRVVHARFIDALRRSQRRTHCIHLRSQLSGPQSENPSNETAARGMPYLEAEGRETQDRLQREVDRLPPPDRKLWSLLLAGERLRDIAQTLEVSYDIVKLRRRRLIAGLQASLGPGSRGGD